MFALYILRTGPAYYYSRRGRPKPLTTSAVEWKFVCSALEDGVPPYLVSEQLLKYCSIRLGNDTQRYVEMTLRKASAKKDCFPFANQHIKLTNLSFFPFDKEIVAKN